jgi:large subunit ribosomal protein L6
MIKGVNELFTEKLILEGIGYKGEVAGDTLTLNLGFSHPVKIKIPADIKVTAEKGIFTFSGHDKEQVSQFAATIRSLKKPEPYKGKGFRYDGEIVRRKQGKKSV